MHLFKSVKVLLLVRKTTKVLDNQCFMAAVIYKTIGIIEPIVNTTKRPFSHTLNRPRHEKFFPLQNHKQKYKNTLPNYDFNLSGMLISG